MTDLASEVAFTYRRVMDIVEVDQDDTGIFSMRPKSGESKETWWARKIKEGRGEEAQRTLEAGFLKYLPDLPPTVFLPVHPEVPPTGGLYSGAYIDRLVYLIPPWHELDDRVKAMLEFQGDLSWAEYGDVDETGMPLSSPQKNSRWWIMPKSLVDASEERTGMILTMGMAHEDAKANGSLLLLDGEAGMENWDAAYCERLIRLGYAGVIWQDVSADGTDPFA